MSYLPNEPIRELIRRKEYAQLRLNKNAIHELQKRLYGRQCNCP